MDSPASKRANFILKWLNEDSSDEDIRTNDDADLSDGPSEINMNNSDTEQSGDDIDEQRTTEIMDICPDPTEVADNLGTDDISAPTLPSNTTVTTQHRQVTSTAFYVGKDKFTKWHVHKLEDHRNKKTSRANIITKLPGVKPLAKNKSTIIDCWKVFFPEETVSQIVKYTNNHLNEIRQSYSRERDCLPTDFDEIMAFFGVLYMLGVKKANHANTNEMWATDGTAPDFFRAVMSERRFHMLVRAIRFDDANTRKDRSKLDNLAPIREVFEQFVSRCIDSYTPGEYLTIDEMLEAFRGRCKFRQYISNKPDKYGIKIYALVDARTYFTVNMEVYCGTQPEGPYCVKNDASSLVKRLLLPVDKSGRNVTTDNYFTSIPLANDLFVNHRTTMVGTVRKNKPQLPPEFKNVKDRPVFSTIFGFGANPNKTLLVSYVPKKNKNVIMLSTLHSEDEIDAETGDSMKPEVISFYNMSKGGVDVVDRMKKEYSVKRVSNRWPMTVFNGLLNLGTINSHIIYKTNTGTTIARRIFIAELAKELVKPHLLKRATLENLPIPLRQSIRNITGQQIQIRNDNAGTFDTINYYIHL